MAISLVLWSGTGNIIGGVVIIVQVSLVLAVKAWLMNRDIAGGIRPWAITNKGIVSIFNLFRLSWLITS